MSELLSSRCESCPRIDHIRQEIAAIENEKETAQDFAISNGIEDLAGKVAESGILRRLVESFNIDEAPDINEIAQGLRMASALKLDVLDAEIHDLQADMIALSSTCDLPLDMYGERGDTAYISTVCTSQTLRKDSDDCDEVHTLRINTNDL